VLTRGASRRLARRAAAAMRRAFAPPPLLLLLLLLAAAAGRLAAAVPFRSAAPLPAGLPLDESGPHSFGFVCGVHFSGTSILHYALGLHPQVSIMRGAPKRQDEGQAFQDVMPTGERAVRRARSARRTRAAADATGVPRRRRRSPRRGPRGVAAGVSGARPLTLAQRFACLALSWPARRCAADGLEHLAHQGAGPLLRRDAGARARAARMRPCRPQPLPASPRGSLSRAPSRPSPQAARLSERSPLHTPAAAKRLRAQWGALWDTRRRVLVEKSPPDLVRMRFLAAVFPPAWFVVIVRHPLAVCRRVEWRMRLLCVHNWLNGYEWARDDVRQGLLTAHVTFYEQWAVHPVEELRAISQKLGLDTCAPSHAHHPRSREARRLRRERR
jgi:hypothetical protein